MTEDERLRVFHRQVGTVLAEWANDGGEVGAANDHAAMQAVMHAWDEYIENGD